MIQELKTKIKELNQQIEKIQEECSHPKDCLKVKNGSNTGNYDPTSDSYWTDYTCGLCEKYWTVFKE